MRMEIIGLSLHKRESQLSSTADDGTMTVLRSRSHRAYAPIADFAAAARGKNLYFVSERLQKSAELLDSQSRVARDTAHCEGIHGIVTRDHEDARAIGHDDVLVLARDVESGFLQRPYSVEVIDAGDLRHALRHLDLANVCAEHEIVAHDEILGDRRANIRERFGFCNTLRPAPWQTRDRDAESFVGPLERNLVFHRQFLRPEYTRIRFISPMAREGALAIPEHKEHRAEC